MIPQTIKRLVGNGLFHVKDALGCYTLKRSLPAHARIVTVLMYHGLDSDPVRLARSTLEVHPDKCLREIQFCLRQGYKLITPAELSDTASCEDDSGVHGHLLVTFDDGYSNTYPHLKKWLTELGIPIVVAICPAIIEEGTVYWWEEVLARLALTKKRTISLRIDDNEELFPSEDGSLLVARCRGILRSQRKTVMDHIRFETADVRPEAIRNSPLVHSNMGWEHLKDLVATGKCAIAAHTLNHDAATSMSLEELERDAQACRRIIESRLGVECRDFIYPFGSLGDYSAETDAVLVRSKYLRTYTTMDHINRVGTTHQLGRIRGVGYGGSLSYYEFLWKRQHGSLQFS